MVLSKPPEASCLKFGLNATLCFEEGASKKSKELSFIQSKGWDEKQRGRPDESNKKKRKEREKAQLAGCWCGCCGKCGLPCDVLLVATKVPGKSRVFKDVHAHPCFSVSFLFFFLSLLCCPCVEAVLCLLPERNKSAPWLSLRGEKGKAEGKKSTALSKTGGKKRIAEKKKRSPTKPQGKR